MTAQAKELLFLDGRGEWLQSLPLEGYLMERNIDPNDFAEYWSSGVQRGYQAVWEIADKRLYLIGYLDCFNRPLDTGKVFGDRALPIAADWFSGRLEVCQGEALTYFHRGWGHSGSTVLRLYLKQGQVVARRRYDQVRLLRLNFDRFVAANPDWRDILAEEQRSGIAPLGGLTAAGVKALGRPELAADEDLSTWPAGLTEEETAEIAADWLQHCKPVSAGLRA